MKTSSSESDIGDYLSNLRKKTIGNKSDFHFDGLSDISLSDLSEKNPEVVEITSKFLKNKKDKQFISEDRVPKKEKTNKKKKERKYKKLTNEKFRKTLVNNIDEKFNVKKNGKESDTSDYIPKLYFNSNYQHSLNLSERSDDNCESSFGKDGNRFIKPKNISENINTIPQSTENKRNNIVTDDISSSRDISSPRKSTLRTVQSPSSKKKVTIMEHKHCSSISSLELDILNSTEDASKSRSDSGSESNRSNFCGLNIMSFNDLVEDVADEQHSVVNSISEYSDRNKFEKIMSIEELEDSFSVKPVDSSHKQKKAYDNNESLSEIKTVPNITPRTQKSLSRNQSISEVHSISLAEPSEVNSVTSRMYSMDFEDSTKERNKKKISKSKSKKSPTYSSDFSDVDRTSQSISKKSVMIDAVRNSSKPEKNSKIVVNSSIPAQLGRERVEHVPIAHYVVSPEALESLTAYSPSMLLMTNMFRQQIQMTTNFIETQRRLYDSLISSIHPTYQYSSLQEAKEFIELNRTKPLTMKEALRSIENGK